MKEDLCFCTLIASLDVMLTGKQVVNNIRSFPESAENWIRDDRILYLSDGGLTRIFWNYESGDNPTIRLGYDSQTSEGSKAQRKQQWEKAKPIIALIEHILFSVFRSKSPNLRA